MTIDPPARAGAWRFAGLWPFFILFGQIDQSGVDPADRLTEDLFCWVWVTATSFLRVTTMTVISTAIGCGYDTERVFIQANPMDLAICDIVAETEKAVQICNVECNLTCWLPKSALKPHNPGVPTYEGHYTIAKWFWSKMNHHQARVLNYP